MEIKQVDFAAKNFVQERTKKNQIVIHHTVSGEGVEGDIAWWNKQTDKIATHYIIDRQGVIHQLFDDAFWAYHLGITAAHFQKFGLSYRNLNKTSIGIELDSWGPVLPCGGKYYPVKFENGKWVANTAAKPIDKYPEEYCTDARYKNHQYYEQYTDKQLGSLSLLLVKLCLEHGISTSYKGDAFWEANKLALSGQDGIWGHCSFRSDKSDPHPQPGLVNLLKRV
jgi:N-acetyl-anhydromuramyl-L-alanine amidase AmpD